LRQDAIGRFL